MIAFWAVLAVVIILTPIVIVHELGHYWACRWTGVAVDEFGIGLPPRAKTLFNLNGTLFSLNWVPLGGFVRPAGENDPSIPQGLAAASPWARLLVLSAGAIANFIMAWLLLWIAFYFGPTATRITAVLPNTPAAEAGLMVNDVIIEMNGVQIDSSRMMSDQIYAANGEELTIIVQRDSQKVTLLAMPYSKETAVELKQQPLGIEVEQTTARGFLGRSPRRAALEANRYLWFLVEATVSTPAQLIQGRINPSDARPASIVGIGQIAGRATANSVQTASLFPFLLISGVISAALGITQLLPLPALDGGRILFVLVELIRGKRVDAQFETAVHKTGMVILLALMVVLIVQDVLNPLSF